MPDDFLPQGYEVPESSGFLKFKEGETRFRIISKPILGWEDWKDKKPIRFKFDEKPQKPIDPAKPIKHFWAMAVWDYQANRVAILEITQKGIQTTLRGLAQDPDWGDPSQYDIKVERKGSGMETEYEVKPVPHKPLTEEIKAACAETKVYLEALYVAGDPFVPF